MGILLKKKNSTNWCLLHNKRVSQCVVRLVLIYGMSVFSVIREARGHFAGLDTRVAGSDEVLRLRPEMGLSWSYVKELGHVRCL